MFDSEGNHEPSNSQVPTTFLLFTRLSWHEHFLSLSYVSNQHPPEQKIFCCVHDFCVFYWCKGCPINHSFHSCFRKFVPFSWRIYFKQCIGFQEVLVVALVEYYSHRAHFCTESGYLFFRFYDLTVTLKDITNVFYHRIHESLI